MEFGSTVLHLENKTILITGPTGFLGKVLLEKILRVQPNVKKLYLLLRAENVESAKERFHNEVIRKELFTPLKQKWGDDLYTLINEKIVFVAGDISYGEDLGVKDYHLMEQMWNELDIIVNGAATTKLDERYDIAFCTNVMGAKHVVCFAKNCVKLKLLLHLSTAFVSLGEKAGTILENPYAIGETLNGTTGLDIGHEKRLIEQKLEQLQLERATQTESTEAMKDMGIERAKTFGWANTYVFTKAMGEMLVGHLKENLLVVIIRPSAITSTYKEPFPGWIEGVRTVDAFIFGYGKGRIPCFLGDLTVVVDVIPADMVINAMVVAMAASANQPITNDAIIYQVCSSTTNPLSLGCLFKYAINYFANNPWIGRDGKTVKVGKMTVLSSMASFQKHMAIRYFPLLQELEWTTTTFWHHFETMYSDLDPEHKFAMRLAKLYEPLLFFRRVFDDKNTEKLRMAARKNGDETSAFCFDPKLIDWEDYFMNIHIPDLVKYNSQGKPSVTGRDFTQPNFAGHAAPHSTHDIQQAMPPLHPKFPSRI